MYNIPNPKQETRTATTIIDEDGSSWPCANGNILAEIFADSPIYRRETPPSVTCPDGRKIGSAENGQRVVRVFVDADTAMQNAARIVGYAPEQFKSSKNHPKTFESEYGKSTNRKLDDFVARLHEPDASAVSASEKIFEQVDQEVALDTISSQMEMSVVGGSPNVGAYLGGSPNSMYRQTSPMRDDGPVRIFVDLSSSAGYSEEGVRGRGIAMLALARCIQRLRPVELWVCTSGTASQYIPEGDTKTKKHMAHTLFAMRLSVSPFDVGMASRMLADPFGGRGFCYRAELRAVGHPCAGDGGLAFSPIPFETSCGATDNDICFGPMYSGAKGAVGQKVSPAEWVKSEIISWLDRNGNTTASAMLG
tara:strand:+ start:651 stop:1742 length:1092 start_codon:yes stop_codon:yes gene_type:complete